MTTASRTASVAASTAGASIGGVLASGPGLPAPMLVLAPLLLVAAAGVWRRRSPGRG